MMMDDGVEFLCGCTVVTPFTYRKDNKVMAFTKANETVEVASQVSV